MDSTVLLQELLVEEHCFLAVELWDSVCEGHSHYQRRKQSGFYGFGEVLSSFISFPWWTIHSAP